MPPTRIKTDAASGPANYKVVDGSTSIGFDDAPAAFSCATSDELRFSESVALMRAFSLIDNDSDRQQVIALAQRLAERD